MQTNETVRYLPWDSEFFGIRIACIDASSLTHETLAAPLSWCREQEIRCVYFLADPSDGQTVRCAEQAGFHLVDLRVTLERSLQPLATPWVAGNSIRCATPDDIEALRAIAAANHGDSRFYHDGGFPKEQCDELYATWIEKSCNGFADAVLVADVDGMAVGYISCHLRENNVGQIGLVGVSSEHQGRGLGIRLLSESDQWFASAGRQSVEVVTQGCNIGAQRLYQKKGFLTKSIQAWYHYWL